MSEEIEDLEDLESLRPLDSLLSEFEPTSQSQTEKTQNDIPMIKLAIPERIVTDEKSPLNQHVEGGAVTALAHCPLFTACGTSQGKTMLFDRENRHSATFTTGQSGSVSAIGNGILLNV